jgi:hypothetical protein
VQRVVTGAIVIAVLAVRPHGQTGDVERVLSLTRAYLLTYEQQLSAVVAEEHYDQWITVPAGPPAGTTTGRMRDRIADPGSTKRALVSEFVMVRWPGEAAWFGFRDVLRVDGRPVRDREERLLKLFTQHPRDVLARADLIAAESARYNIGGVARNINVPTQALDFLHERHQARFHFSSAGTDTIDGVRATKVAFEEREPPYLISTLSGGGIKARGTAWIDPQSGEISQTQLDLTIVESRQVLRSRITVLFRPDTSLGLRVPVELRETHEQSDPASRVGRGTVLSGLATYRNFRRFSTETREQLAR